MRLLYEWAESVENSAKSLQIELDIEINKRLELEDELSKYKRLNESLNFELSQLRDNGVIISSKSFKEPLLDSPVEVVAEDIDLNFNYSDLIQEVNFSELFQQLEPDNIVTDKVPEASEIDENPSAKLESGGHSTSNTEQLSELIPEKIAENNKMPRNQKEAVVNKFSGGGSANSPPVGEKIAAIESSTLNSVARSQAQQGTKAKPANTKKTGSPPPPKGSPPKPKEAQRSGSIFSFFTGGSSKEKNKPKR